MTELPEWYAVVRSTLAAPFRHSTMFAWLCQVVLGPP
jgi:hypothetical protein